MDVVGVGEDIPRVGEVPPPTDCLSGCVSDYQVA